MRTSIYGVKNCVYILNYFDNYSLKTKKLQVYNDWKFLYEAFVNKDHLDEFKVKALKILSKNLNKI